MTNTAQETDNTKQRE